MLDACAAGTANIGRTVLLINITQAVFTALFAITRCCWQPGWLSKAKPMVSSGCFWWKRLLVYNTRLSLVYDQQIPGLFSRKETSWNGADLVCLGPLRGGLATSDTRNQRPGVKYHCTKTPLTLGFVKSINYVLHTEFWMCYFIITLHFATQPLQSHLGTKVIRCSSWKITATLYWSLAILYQGAFIAKHMDDLSLLYWHNTQLGAFTSLLTKSGAFSSQNRVTFPVIEHCIPGYKVLRLPLASSDTHT